jgi:hypothetical protein
MSDVSKSTIGRSAGPGQSQIGVTGSGGSGPCASDASGPTGAPDFPEPAEGKSGGSDEAAYSLSLISVCKRGNEPQEEGFSPDSACGTEARIERFRGWKATSQESVKVGAAVGAAVRKLRNQDRCATHLVFHEYGASVGRPALSRLAEVYCCQNWKTCIVCAHRRSALALDRYVPRICSYRLQNRRSRVFMVELGIRDGEDLGERLGVLEAAWQRLRQAAYNARRGKSASIFGQVLGSVGQVEVHRGKNSGLWHPHIHALMIFDRDWLQVERIGAEWTEFVGEGYRAWCHVQKSYADKLVPLGTNDIPDFDRWERQSYRDACEVLKYCTKLDMTRPGTLADAWDVAGQTESMRFIRALGCLRRKGDVEVQAGPDPEDSEGREPDEVRHFAWRRALGRYVEALEWAENGPIWRKGENPACPVDRCDEVR